MENKQDILIKIIWAFVLAILVIGILGLIGTEIYVWIKYANTPINELPAWVIFFMFGHR